MTRQDKLKIRDLTTDDINHIANYWLKSDDDYLMHMGVDLNKLPTRDGLTKRLTAQISQTDTNKTSLAMILEYKGNPVGHCNVNRILFGKEAYMHLHIWDEKNRRKGWGSQMVKLAIPLFFDRLKLQRLWCEPYAKNLAPNKALLAIGFKYTKTHVTVPGSINFEQEVNTYVFEKNDLNLLEIGNR